MDGKVKAGEYKHEEDNDNLYFISLTIINSNRLESHPINPSSIEYTMHSK